MSKGITEALRALPTVEERLTAIERNVAAIMEELAAIKGLVAPPTPTPPSEDRADQR